MIFGFPPVKHGCRSVCGRVTKSDFFLLVCESDKLTSDLLALAGSQSGEFLKDLRDTHNEWESSTRGERCHIELGRRLLGIGDSPRMDDGAAGDMKFVKNGDFPKRCA
jgi:hypothetical protein